MNTEKVQKFLKNIKKLDIEISKLNDQKDQLCKEYDKAVIESSENVPTNVEVMRKAQELTRQKAQAAVDRKKLLEGQLKKQSVKSKKKPVDDRPVVTEMVNNETEDQE